MNPKVALAHDWLNGMRGGERVLELLCQEYPDAPIYTLLHKHGAVSDTIERHEINTSFLQHIPGIQSRYRYALPLFPMAVKGLNAGEVDLVISSSHCVAKAVVGSPNTRHLCYCFTPMRYAWTFYDEYFGTSPVKKAILKPTLAALRKWDLNASEKVDKFVAISHHVKDRIKTYYGRTATVVYPPVDTERCTPSGEAPHDYDLVVSALVPYKKIDLAVEAYNKLGTPLKIVGTGTEFDELKSRAKSNIEFLGWQSDEQVTELYRNCRVLIFPGEEDFGIVPVEAQACGRPVIAYGKGGALETIQENISGAFFKEQTSESLLNAIEESKLISWDTRIIRTHAESFDTQYFLTGIREAIKECHA